MSPPNPPPAARARTLSLPPSPPPGLEGRVWVLEHTLGIFADVPDRLTGIENALIVMNTEKSAAEKRHDHFMKWLVGTSVGVSVVALGTLAAWVLHLQNAMAAVSR